MKDYKTDNLRNVGIIGHSSSGKTALAEALLYYTKTIDRLGKIEEGTTTSDYDVEEKKRGISLSASVIPFEWNDKKINLVDIPGYFDFVGEEIQGIRAIDVSMIVVCGAAGIQVGTEKAWEYCNKMKLPRAFFINKLDRENSDYDKVLADLKSKFGITVVPIQYPIGKESEFTGVIDVIKRKVKVHDRKNNKVELKEVPEEYLDKVQECKQMIMEAVAETDEELLDKYFSEGELTDEEIYRGLINGCCTGEIAPVMCGSSLEVIGMGALIEDIVGCFPSPDKMVRSGYKKLNDNNNPVKIDDEKPFSAFVFKTVADPFVGKLSIFRVLTGKAVADSIVYNSSKERNEKMGNLYFLRGKNQMPTKEVTAGDIGAVAKLQYTATGDTICDSNNKVIYEPMEFPDPVISMAVLPKSKGDEDKISSALTKLLEEDPTFRVSRDVENAETIISGVGETHLDVIASKLKNKFGAEVILQNPKVPYRETIKGIADVQGKHKKQSGGHGQYGDVKIKFEPRNDGYDELQFVDQVVGGVVPRNYIPAVEKGLKDCILHGVLAGYPVIRLRATLHDGSYHPVDSSEMAFKIAASLAYKKGVEMAKPILLEPIMHLEVMVPSDYMGDVIGDINKKRGRVLGMEPVDGMEKVTAEVPMAELFKYATDLRSISQARGSFRCNFERYEEVPALEADKIIENSKKLRELRSEAL
ncbi:elongation factor G [Clostridium fungisolvens]|uniref:Elongation factor G n=1 Tax=Clostridium fungisolvens TaxID=1604897 RepID=A0A6V8SUG5_9CLOT|nr:elongation factor G [Clostridium fungisolvens]GFP78523.1 Elongation factor G [Clostridium fungisolvens]